MGDSAVIINEFGEVGLDHLLVEAIDGEVAVLASGCVCCTLRSDLEQTLRGLLSRRDRGEVPTFSRILGGRPDLRCSTRCSTAPERGTGVTIDGAVGRHFLGSR